MCATEECGGCARCKVRKGSGEDHKESGGSDAKGRLDYDTIAKHLRAQEEDSRDGRKPHRKGGGKFAAQASWDWQAWQGGLGAHGRRHPRGSWGAMLGRC